jgi:hypothetical protein
MNTAERIVESYFRYCRSCLTIPDVKIAGGNNRQIDLLAWHPKTETAYHVESTVVPSGRYFNKSGSWRPVTEIFQNKFFAQPKVRQTPTFIPAKDDVEYLKLQRTYALYNFAPERLKRVWVCWHLDDYSVTVPDIVSYFADRDVPQHLVEVISFRDEVVPALERQIGSSNYEDDVLRTFSFFSERDEQLKMQPTAPPHKLKL